MTTRPGSLLAYEYRSHCSDGTICENFLRIQLYLSPSRIVDGKWTVLRVTTQRDDSTSYISQALSIDISIRSPNVYHVRSVP